MTGEPESWESRLAILPRLVREHRLEEAGSLLDSLIATSPELAARLLVLARFIALDPEEWDRRMQTVLAQYGGAPLAAYRRAMRVLDGRRHQAEVISRLQEWSAAWKPPGHASQPLTDPEWVHRAQLWHKALQARRAWWRLEGAARCVARLEAVSDRLPPVAFPLPGSRAGRIVERLVAWQGAWPA